MFLAINPAQSRGFYDHQNQKRMDAGELVTLSATEELSELNLDEWIGFSRWGKEMPGCRKLINKNPTV